MAGRRGWAGGAPVRSQLASERRAGYGALQPCDAREVVTIFRAVNNFVFVGDDGATPAMRLGLAQEPRS